MFAAYHMENIVGVYILIKTRPGTMEIVNIAIEEVYRGKGLGKLLIKDAIHNAAEHGVKVLDWHREFKYPSTRDISKGWF